MKEDIMKEDFEVSRRSFIKAAGAATVITAMGAGVFKEAQAAALDFVSQRQVSVYQADVKVYKLRKSQDNPMIKKIYASDGFLSDGPTGKKAYQLLHTRYFDRSMCVKELKAQGIKLKI